MASYVTPTSQSAARAIVVKQDYSYPWDADWLDPATRTATNQKHVKNGCLSVVQGELSWLIAENGAFARCVFPRHQDMVEVDIPLAILTVGEEQRSITYSSLDLASEQHLENARSEGTTPLEHFIWEFLLDLAASEGKLSQLSLEPRRFQYLFGTSEKTKQTIRTVVAAITNPVKRLLATGDFTYSDVVQLPNGTSTPQDHQIIYIRIYTDQEDAPCGTSARRAENVAGYGGRTSDSKQRDVAHVENIEDGTNTPHYHQARRSPEDSRYCLLFADCIDLDDDLISLIEEIACQVLGTFASFQFVCQLETVHSQRIRFLDGIARRARTKANFHPPRIHGCNSISPFFETDRGRSYTLFRQPPRPGVPPMLIYKTAYHVRKVGGTDQYRVLLAAGIPLFIQQGVVEQCGLEGKSVFVCFEITEDGSRHPDAWCHASDVGLFENNAFVAQLSVRLEYYKDEQNKWFTTWLHSKGHGPTHASNGPHPKSWIRARKIIMALRREEWTSTNKWFDRMRHLVGSIQELRYDHLTMSAEWVSIAGPRQQQDLPTLASFAENHAALRHEYPDLVLGPPPDPTLFHLNTDCYDRKGCLSCYWYGQSVNRVGQSPTCKRDSPRDWACHFCIARYNRPCIWIYAAEAEAMTEEERRPLIQEGMKASIVETEIPCPYGGDHLLQLMMEADIALDDEEDED